MHQSARGAAPRDPLVQHACLHVCLAEKLFNNRVEFPLF